LRAFSSVVAGVQYSWKDDPGGRCVGDQEGPYRIPPFVGDKNCTYVQEIITKRRSAAIPLRRREGFFDLLRVLKNAGFLILS
jgi:hypothetical protein